MKSKKAIVILLPAVLFVWIALFMRIFGNLDNNSSNVIIVEPGNFEKTTGNFTDSFNIAANYRDPFIGTIKHHIKTQSITKQHTNPNKTKVLTQQKSWPQIKYSGSIRNQKSNKQIAMIQVNGKSNMLAVGSSVEGITLKRIYKDSIQVIFGKEFKMIKKG